MPHKENQFPFTPAVLDQLEIPEKRTVTYKDTKTGYLSLYVTPNGVKTFFVRKRVKGRDERLVIGRYPIISIKQARQKGAILCGIIADRKDPLEEFRKEKLNRKTFGEHFAEYMHRYSKLHKKSWEYDEREINRFVGHWFNRKLSDIKKSDVELLHEKIGRENGYTQANTIVRRLSSIFNKAISWGWEGVNPAKGIQKFKEQARDRFIMPNEMPYILRALDQEHNEDLRDYFLMLFMTGVRKTNALMMRWDQINYELKEWRIPETKNGEPLVLPLIQGAIDILKRRQLTTQSKWVFPQKENPKLHIKDPIKAWKRIRSIATLEFWNSHEPTAEFIRKYRDDFKSYYAPYTLVEKIEELAQKEGYELPPTYMDIRIHDIRRTFGSYQALTGASLSIIGRSLGHKSVKATQIYARLNLDPVRESVEKANHAMFGSV
jgi:integrase